jgi:uncharacterized protein YndB with AHSA1/START domain
MVSSNARYAHAVDRHARPRGDTGCASRRTGAGWVSGDSVIGNRRNRGDTADGAAGAILESAVVEIETAGSTTLCHAWCIPGYLPFNKGEHSMSNTIRLHRVLRAKPECIYRAFLDADAIAKWLPPNGFTCKVHHLDATVGGGYRMSFTNFTTGGSHSFGGEYLELVPHRRIRHTDRFDDPNLPGEMQTTITLKKAAVGTELNIVQEGIPAAIPPEACYLGWQESLVLLAKLVEAEIPD